MRLKPVFATYDWKENSGVERFKYCPVCGTGFVPEAIGYKLRPLCPECGFIYFRNPSPTVSILVVEGDKVLLGKRSAEPGKGRWGLPSGYIEFDEDFLAAAVREVREETGLEVEIQSVMNVQSAFLPPEYHFLGIYVLARVAGGELAAGDDVEEVGWFPLRGALPEMAFQPDVDLIDAYSDLGVEGLPVGDSGR